MSGSIQPKMVLLLLFLTVTGVVLGTGENEDPTVGSNEQELTEELLTVEDDIPGRVEQEGFSCNTEPCDRQREDCTVGNICNPADNCSHILSLHPGSSSGYYWIQSSPGYAVKVYCDMERVCGCGEGGGWMRVADIDMTRPNQTCPTGFRQITTTDGKTICGGENRQCVNTTFITHRLLYSRVCGRIIGYQFGYPNCFGPYSTKKISSRFVDGIVLTHGSTPTHIWTFAAGKNQFKNTRYTCPCNDYNVSIPPFVGNDYFCDSGHTHRAIRPFTYLTHDPLWDGQGCIRGSCCSFNNPPWFCKELSQTNDDIDLHLCINQPLWNEDVPFEKVELYIQ